MVQLFNTKLLIIKLIKFIALNPEATIETIANHYTLDVDQIVYIYSILVTLENKGVIFKTNEGLISAYIVHEDIKDSFRTVITKKLLLRYKYVIKQYI
jgi:hypothetical protein